MAALDDDAFHTKDLMKDTANLLEAENSGNYNVYFCLLFSFFFFVCVQGNFYRTYLQNKSLFLFAQDIFFYRSLK